MGFRDMFKSSRPKRSGVPPPQTTPQVVSRNKSSIYNEPLSSPTTIRLLVLAPSRLGDGIICVTMNMDLDAAQFQYAKHERWQDSIGMASIKTQPEPLTFIMDVDYIFNDETHEQRWHPYQRYFAVSYVWGSAEDPEYITMNGQRISVTKNLYLALRRIRDPTRGVRVWVDALCINQNDSVEKAGQIALMTRIYKQAEFVKASVATDFEDEKGVENILKAIIQAGRKSEALEKVEPGYNPVSYASKRGDGVGITLFLSSQEHAMEYQGLPALEDSAWRPWRRLWACPYFRRMWILQEYTLAKDTTLMVGRLDIKVNAVEECVRLLQHYSVSPSFMYVGVAENDDVTSAKMATFGMFAAQRLHRERFDKDFPERTAARENRLIYKLDRGRLLEASQPRDKLFALLGISSDAHIYQDLVTYVPSVSTEEICTRFAKRFVGQGHGLEVLYQARCSPSVPGLPTWVPYWPEATSNLRIVDDDSYDHAFNAAGDTIADMTVLPDSKLMVRGAICDRIVDLSDPLDPQVTQAPGHRQMQGTELETIHLLQFLAKGGMFSSSIEPYPTGETKEEVLIRTFVRGPPWHKKNSSTHVEELKKLKEAFWLQFEEFGLGKAEKESIEPKRRDEIEAQTSVFARDAAPRAYKRRFCITEKGYFGFVPDTTKVGDGVGIVCGGPIPVVLRAGGDASRRHYELIGDGYFHGMMHGEALESPGVKMEELFIT